MKLGLLTDIHERADLLKSALAHFDRESVDQVVVLGDVADLFTDHAQLEETCRLLLSVKTVGVWGNHDYNLCSASAAELAERFAPIVHEFFASLRPRLELEDCLFTHVEPWLDTAYMPNLWHFGRPDKEESERETLFAMTSHRVMFAGHYHRWLHLTPRKNVLIGGDQMDLSKGRHFVVLGALCNGQFATYDTTSGALQRLDSAAMSAP